MVGGGGDAPPVPTPPAPPINGGEFLLQLLKNPPQHHPPPSPSPSPSPSQPQSSQEELPHDPAVAAVGPSVPFSRPLLFPPPPPHTPYNNNNNNNNNNSSSSSSNYFIQQQQQQQGLGFPSNFIQQQQQQRPHQHDQGVLDYLSKLGLIHSNHQQQQEQDRHNNNNLVFGSLHSHFQTSKQVVVSKNAKLDYDLATIEKHDLLLKEERGRLNAPHPHPEPPDIIMSQQHRQLTSLTFGNYVSTSHHHHQQQQVWRMPPPPPPPGFSRMDDYKGGEERFHLIGGVGAKHSGDLNHRPLHSLPPATHLHDPTEKIHSVELDDLVDNLLLEDAVKKGPKSRDKDYRSDKRGQWLLNQRMRNHRSHTECRRDINRLNAHFLEIFESLIPPEEEKEKQKQLMALLNKHVTNEWPRAQLFLYGSCANSFGFRKSDIDVCLAMGDVDVDKSEILLKLADILKSKNLENVQALTRARVPIVKLMDPVTGISCDICVNNLLAVINTKLLRDYSKIDVRLRQLAFIVKHWAKSRGVNETYQGTLSSYAYVLMCIHFLQQRTPSILPCLQGMEVTYKVNVDNVECSYFDQVEKLQGFGSRNGESIAQLVWAFFNYWAYCHDYANDVISIRIGSLISKREKDWTRRIGNDRHLICIEDPFEVSHDLGRVVDKRSIRVLREEFERAAEILQYDPNPCVKLFEPYVPS